MKTPYKLRAWNIIVERMHYFTLNDIGSKITGKIQWHILEIMWFTGFHDKNNREIFDGDIFKTSNGNHYYVVFENGSFVCYHAKNMDLVNNTKLKWGLLSRAYELNEDFIPEVIGNIYENKELL